MKFGAEAQNTVHPLLLPPLLNSNLQTVSSVPSSSYITIVVSGTTFPSASTGAGTPSYQLAIVFLHQVLDVALEEPRELHHQ